MSRFTDKLKQTSRAEPQPMGFRKASEITKPRLLLVAEAKSATADLDGADAVLLDAKPKTPLTKTALPTGVRLFGTKPEKLKGLDFVVLLPDMPVNMVEDEEIGRIMAVDAATEMGLLRSLEGLPLDAIMIIGDSTQAPLITWHYLMLCRRLAAIAGKPVLASVPSGISKDELQLVWESGVDGVVAAAKTDGGIKKLRALIEELTPPDKSKRNKSRAIVPSISQSPAAAAEEDDGDEEYDDE